MRPATAGRHSLPAHTRDATTQDQTLKRSLYGSRGLPTTETVTGCRRCGVLEVGGGEVCGVDDLGLVVQPGAGRLGIGLEVLKTE
jgi:hypothetical protein